MKPITTHETMNDDLHELTAEEMANLQGRAQMAEYGLLLALIAVVCMGAAR